MHHFILSSVACPVVQYFSTLSHKSNVFLNKKKLQDINCVFGFTLKILSETFLILRRIKRDKIVKRSRYRPGVAQRVAGN